MRLVECVPNISEGRNQSVIDAIASEVAAVENVSLLDVDRGVGTNRTVITFVGEPDAAAEAAFRLIAKAASLIDMRRHSGEHPRNGATDVCPFVPLGETSMDECVALARKLGERVGRELEIPVYMYGEAAILEKRKRLSDIRDGEYEALKRKLQKNEWRPDFGPSAWSDEIARTGATQIGARPFLVAYNINLNTKDVRFARRIGKTIRESGGAVVRDVDGKKQRGDDGKLLRHEKGLFSHLSATGWYIEEYKLSQVTMNLNDFRTTPIHVVFDKVQELATGLGLRVTGSEIVGLVPRECLLAAGRYYLEKQGASIGVPEPDVVAMAVQSLGLSDIARFEASERVVEYRVARAAPLLENRLTDFNDELSRSSPVPGGGSVSALLGALAAGLVSMVANLTAGKRGNRKNRDLMQQVAHQAQELKDVLLRTVQEDADAFDRVLACFKIPKGEEREKAIVAAQRGATLVPFSVLERVAEALDLIELMEQHGLASALSDVGVAALNARAAAKGAYFNILINLKEIDEPEFTDDIGKRADELVHSIEERATHLEEKILKKLTD